jgi:class 3 adenylate cyclase/predicted ATPase
MLLWRAQRRDMPDIASWLAELGLGRYAGLFAANEVDFDSLRYLTEEDLKAIGLPLGPRRKVLAGIAALPKQAQAQSTSGSEFLTRRNQAERRHLTVMFVDLAGSTALSARHDPEDMRETVWNYQKAVASEVRQFEGHVAKFMGDGVLAYFGWPRAHEDDAERAVRAGLAIVEQVALLKTPAGKPLSCRVGIATGNVVVGDLVGEGAAQEEAVVGATPNLAARLQELAAPGRVVVSEQTRRLLGGGVVVEDLGPVKLKGFAEPLRAFSITGERAVESRFAARTTASVSLVGREEELSILTRRWELAKRGEGQLVLLSGEPGIGKSRLVLGLLERITGEPHLRINFQCSPFHVYSAFYPVVSQIARDAGFAAEDLPEQKMDKLRDWLMRAKSRRSDELTVFAALLSLPDGGRLSEIEPDPERRRARIFEALLHQCKRLAKDQPLICVFEDMHWSDPSTKEFVERLVEWIPSWPVLLLVTCRPEFASPWTGLAHSTLMALTRLSVSSSAELVTRLAGEKRLPGDVARQIIAKTDGIPLFIEELTRTVIESEANLPQTGDLVPHRSLPPDTFVPATLHDSLMARLDRLPDVRDVAQLGAVIGRSFDYKLFNAVAGEDDKTLTPTLVKLEEAGILIRRGNPPDSSYSFRHALIQDVAYGSLLRGKRRGYHRRIAAALERLSPGVAETDPALLAHHYAQGGEPALAVRYLRRAGERAVAAAANAEAADNFAKALTLLEDVPESPKRANEEIAIRLSLGGVQVQELGPGSAEAEHTYIRAKELCESSGKPQQHFTALWGMWFVYYHRGDMYRAREFGDALLSLSQTLDDTALTLEAHHVQWGSLTLTGDFRGALAHAEEGISLYDRDRHHSLTFVYGGHDPGGCAHGLGAVILCLLGYPKRARQQCAAALTLARGLNHPYTVFESLFDALVVDLLTRDLDAIDEHTGVIDGLLQDRRLSSVAWGVNSGCRGWLLAERGFLERGLELMRNSQSSWRSHFGAWCYPLDACLATLLGRAARAEEGLQLVDQSLQAAAQGGAHWWDGELYRVRASLHYLQESDKRREAEADLEKAITDARGRGARYLELRAANELARLWAQSGDRLRARDLLAPIYDWFIEGSETPDLIEARDLLNTLR